MSKNLEKFIQGKNKEKKLFTPGPASLLKENISSIQPCFGRGDTIMKNWKIMCWKI